MIRKRHELPVGGVEAFMISLSYTPVSYNRFAKALPFTISRSTVGLEDGMRSKKCNRETTQELVYLHEINVEMTWRSLVLVLKCLWRFFWVGVK